LAVRLAGETDHGMSADERWARGVAAPQLAAHAPSNRHEPAPRRAPRSVETNEGELAEVAPLEIFDARKEAERWWW
jgi:hypothetical protein